MIHKTEVDQIEQKKGIVAWTKEISKSRENKIMKRPKVKWRQMWKVKNRVTDTTKKITQEIKTSRKSTKE
jgi:hypothetical protein